MEAAMTLHNLWGHFHTITVHKFRVMKNCFRVGLYKQGLLHDLSKYGPEEFIPGVIYYQGRGVPTLQKGRRRAFRRRGFTTRGGINITTNTGSTYDGYVEGTGRP